MSFFLLRWEIVLGCTGQFFGCDGNSLRCYFLTYRPNYFYGQHIIWDLAGTGTTLFSSGLFWDWFFYLRFFSALVLGTNWCTTNCTTCPIYVYNTVVRLCHFVVVAEKLILYEFSCWIQIFFSYMEIFFSYKCGCSSKISRTFYASRNLWIIIVFLQRTLKEKLPLFLALYGSTTIQSCLFLKYIKNFVWFTKQYLLGFFILEKQFANIPDRGFLFLRITLLLYSLSPHWRTERRTESQIHSLRVGWRNLFSSCVV
jgi:hypothetical protein